MPLRTPCVVLAYLELRLSSVRVPCGCPVDFRATSTNGYSAWIAIGFTLVILCRDRRSSPMGDGLLGEPGVRPCISLARILQVGTTRARRRSDGPDGTGRCTSLPWQPGRQAQDQTQEKYPPNSGSPGSPAGQARQRKSASGVTAPMVRTALRVSVHVHHERTRYGTRNRPARDRHTDRDHRRKPARRCTLGERIEAPKVLRDDVYVQDAVGRAETPLASARTHVFESSAICGQACSTADDNRPRGNLRSSPPISARGWNLRRPGAAHLQGGRRWSGLSKGTARSLLARHPDSEPTSDRHSANLRDGRPPAARPRAPAVGFFVRRTGAECRR